MRKQTFGALIVAAGIALLGGCAGTGPSSAARPLPPAKALQPADLASLAGEWGGTLQGVSGQLAGRRTSLVRVTVAPDGSFTSNIDGVPGVGKARIADGKILFEGSSNRGTATLHEGDGRRVIAGQGTWVGFPGESAFEITKR